MDPVPLAKPIHPDAEEEAEKRIGLYEAIKADIELLKEMEEVAGVAEKKAIIHVRWSLQRIIDRWEGKATFHLDKKEKVVVRSV